MSTQKPQQARPVVGPTIERLPDVLARTGLARSTVYAAIQSGHFPQQVLLTKRSVGFLTEEVNAWIEAQAAKRAPKRREGN